MLREWEISLKGNEPPSLKQLLDFIAHRCQALEATATVAVTKKNDAKSQSNIKQQSSCAATIKSKCHFCQGDHVIYYCKNFVALPVPQRGAEIRSRKLCTNCLRSSHTADKCNSGQCKVCQAKHNTLLHVPSNTEVSTSNSNKEVAPKAPSVLATHASGSFSGQQVILSTAVVHAHDSEGSPRACRVLLDCGSQANFVSKKFVKALGLRTRPLSVSISGVNGTVATIHQVAQIKLQSRFNSYTGIDCIVADQVTDKIPAFSLRRDKFEFPHNIRLADPRFHISSEVDLLIGAKLFWELMCVGQIQSSDKHPTLQKTQLGWILADRLGNTAPAPERIHSLHASITNSELHEQVSRAWQMDDIVVPSNNYTIEESACERYFLDNVSQDSNGRFMVKLPVEEQVLSNLGDSREIAIKRLRGIERRFKRELALKVQYAAFLEEYLSLGHMRRLEPPITDEPISFYLPHHCVFKAFGQSSKILENRRIVFDASYRSSSVSLNDALLVGPVVQQDLISILMRFRFFIYIFTADIVKMYRQISVHPSQTCLQRILWRENSSADIDTYELTTVTYGTASASFLATMCLKYLAEQRSAQFPHGSACVIRDFYVDDMLIGADIYPN